MAEAQIEIGSINEYLSSLAPLITNPFPPITLETDAPLSLALFAFYTVKRYQIPRRMRAVRAIVSTFSQWQPLGDVALTFSLLKKTAYMTDGGQLVLPLSLITRKHSVRILKILFHELAHLHLTQLPEYGNLLALDRQFLQRFGNTESVLTISPVERYATQLSCIYLESAAAILSGEEATALTQAAKEENEKLLLAYQNASPYLH